MISPSCVLGAIALYLVVYYLSDRRRRYPPGPPRIPLIGNAHQMPTEKQWFTFVEWGKKYGEITYLSAFGTPIIILNSTKVAFELLDKRGSIYSDRPRLPMAGEMLGYEDSLPLCKYDNRHRQYRKLFFETLSPRKTPELFHIHEEKMQGFIDSLKASPEKYLEHTRRMVAAIAFQISHGYTPTTEGKDRLVDLAERASTDFSMAVAPGAFLVDTLPILRYIPDWFPGADFKRKAKAWRATMIAVRDEPYEKIRKQVAEGTALPSFTSNLIERNPNPSLEEELLYKWASVGFYSAGADTTVSAVSSFFLAMVLYPEIQKKAQAELDTVVGLNRSPKLSDRPNLPYLEALVNEVYRWNPVTPFAIPHRSTADDEYEGMYIPAGSLIFCNSWGMLHDEKLYPLPFEFMPERYLSGCKDGLNPDPRTFAFGYGRRVCPGQTLAEATVFLSAAAVLSEFTIAKAINADGSFLEPSLEYTSGIISHPPPYPCRIIPRSTNSKTSVY